MSKTLAARSVSWLAVVLLGLVLAGCSPPTDEELYAKSEAALAKGDYASARIHLLNILQREDGNVEARLRLADIDLDASKTQAAEGGYIRVLKADPANVRALAGRAQAMALDDRLDDALKLLQPDLAKSPADRARLLGLRGTLLMKKGDLEAARKCMDDALLLTPDDPDRIVELAQLEQRAGRPAEADRLIAQALALKPDHARAILVLGVQQRTRNQLMAAEATYRRAAEAAEAAHQRQVRLDALLALVEVQLGRQQTEAARQTLEVLNQIAPDAPQVRYNRAKWAASLGDDQKATDELLLLLRDHPDSLPARRLLGITYARQGKWNLAESHLAAVVAAQPQDREAQAFLKSVRAQEFMRIDGDVLSGGALAGPTSERKQSLTMAGTQQFFYGRPAKALEYFRAAEKDFPKDVQVRLNTAQALVNSGKYDEAIQKLEADDSPATELARKSILVFAWLGKGDLPRALELAGDLAAKNPGEAWTHDLHATVLSKAGRAKDALAALNAALAADPQDPFAIGVLAQIALDAGDVAAAEALLARAPADAAGARMLRAKLALLKGDAPAARALAESVLKDDASNADGHYIRGVTMLAAQPGIAVSEFEQARLLAPEVPFYARNLADAYLATGNVEAAKNAAAEARALGVAPADLADLDFRLELASGDLKGAEAALAKVTPSDPQSLQRALLTAELRQAEGNPGGAADALSAAYARAPSKTLAIRTALARQAAGRADALLLLEEWQQKNGPDAEILSAEGGIEYANGNRAAAVKKLEAALRIDSGNVEALNNLANWYQEAGDRRAPEIAERALRAAPDNPAVLDTAGWIRLKAGKNTDALTALTRASALAPNDAEIRFHLAMALSANQRDADARQLLEGLLRTNAKFPSRELATAELERLRRG